MDKTLLMKELEEKFKKLKLELGFKVTLDELDKKFFIRDAILNSEYVSDRLDRQISIRLVESYYSWVGQFQAWLTPGIGGSIVNHNEVKSFSESDRDAIKKLIHKAMYFLRADKAASLRNDKGGQGKLIDEMYKESHEFFNNVSVLLEKARDGWGKED